MTIINTDRLPLRKRAGGWQLRKWVASGKRLEVSLGTADRKLAEQRAAQIIGQYQEETLSQGWARKIEDGMRRGGWLRAMACNVTARAKKKGGGVDIKVLQHIAARACGRCEVSGMPFYTGEDSRHPQQPSIDRIDSSRGYEADNLRMVCLAVNYCMSHWGERVFYAIASAVVAKKLADLGGNWGQVSETANSGRAAAGE